MYHELTVKKLRERLRDRNAVGRSKLTTRKQMIAKLIELDECDHLSAVETPAPGVESAPELDESPVVTDVETPVENFTGSPPLPIAPPIPEPDESPTNDKAQTLENSLPNSPAGKNFTDTPQEAIAPPIPEPEPEDEDEKQPCLSVRQPWAWAIFHLGKNIENRTWGTSHRGRLFVHAGKKYDSNGARWIYKNFGVRPPEQNELPMGAIVGHVDIVDCSENSDSPWAIPDCWYWEIDNPVEIAPIPCLGRLGIFYRSIPPEPQPDGETLTFIDSPIEKVEWHEVKVEDVKSDLWVASHRDGEIFFIKPNGGIIGASVIWRDRAWCFSSDNKWGNGQWHIGQGMKLIDFLAARAADYQARAP